jgi:hypothetical protein
MRATDEQRRHRRRRLPWLAILVAAAALPVAAALAAPSGRILVADATGDVSGPLDVQRAALSLSSDRRLRFVVTFAAEVTPKTLLADTGPPGSACARIWTDPDADPAATRPDRLVCATSDKDGKLRASVLEQRDAGLPHRLGAASVSLSPAGRSLTIRVSQSALGRPARIRFAVESTRPGCDRVACVDNVPDAGAVRRFRLR